MPYTASYLRFTGNGNLALIPGVWFGSYGLVLQNPVTDGQKTAEELVRMARQYAGILDTGTFRDGFPDDTDAFTGTFRVLDFVNEAKRQLLKTGYAKCRLTLPTEGFRYEYTLDPYIHEVLSATWRGKPLKPVTPGFLDERYPHWRFYGSDPEAFYGGSYELLYSFATGPRYYYTFSDQIGLWPPPQVDDIIPEDPTVVGEESLELLADVWVPDMVERSDVPGRLPSRLMPALAIFAAMLMCNADMENEASARRLTFLSGLWQADFADLQQIVQSRDLNRESNIQLYSYRERFKR